MHFEILDGKREGLLHNIVDTIDYVPYVLGGGTGLSLQLGIRKSYDFDFFLKERFNPERIYQSLKEIAKDTINAINVNDSGTCDVIVDGVQVSFFYYPHKEISPLVKPDKMPSLQILGVPDIAAMKCVAIGNRGTKKDFFDLYEIIQHENVSPAQLSSWLINKYGNDRNFSYIAMGMNYFEDAEGEELPEVYVPYDWNKIKDFFVSYQGKLIHALEYLQ